MRAADAGGRAPRLGGVEQAGGRRGPAQAGAARRQEHADPGGAEQHGPGHVRVHRAAAGRPGGAERDRVREPGRPGRLLPLQDPGALRDGKWHTVR